MQKIKILIVDDEKDILNILKYSLSVEGYDVYDCNDSINAIQIAQKIIPDIFILDVMMPKKNGFELCQQIRSIDVLKNKYIFFLTALADEKNHLKGLETGADDFLHKPISIKILNTKIAKIVQKIYPQIKDNHVLEFGDLKIFSQDYKIEIAGKIHQLPKKEFELLCFLASKSGMVLQRERILQSVWGDQVVVNDRTIDVHIRKLRKKMGIDCIHTLKGVGYKFEY